MAKWTKSEDIARIQRAQAKLLQKNNGKPIELHPPLKIVKAEGDSGYKVILPSGAIYSSRGKPVIMPRTLAEWYSYRLDPSHPAPSVQANMPMYIAPTKKDIFESGLMVNDEIVIVAPGYNGRDLYKYINPKKFTIVVNKAIECPVHADLWMACEPLTGRTEWFKKTIGNKIDIACFWSHYLYKQYPDIKYTYEFGPPLTKTSSMCIPGVLRGRATVSAQALQLAYWLGATRIIILGIDLMGNKYFDNSDAGAARPETAWSWILPLFNPLIQWIKAQGIDVVSLSETALDVPVVE
jgi:hypothetical protein